MKFGIVRAGMLNEGDQPAFEAVLNAVAARRAQGAGLEILTAVAIETDRDQPAPMGRTGASRIATILAAVDPKEINLPKAVRVPGDGPGRLLSLPPGRAANVAGHRLSEERVDAFNRLVYDAALVTRNGLDPGDSVRDQNAYLPVGEQLEEAVVDLLLARVAAATPADLARTVEAFDRPDLEVDRKAKAVRGHQVAASAASAAKYGLDEEDDDLYEVQSRTAAEWADARESGELRVDYLVDRLVVRGQYGTLIAPAKTCKTLTATALAVHGALGAPVFGHQAFGVSRPFRTLLLTRESDAALLVEATESICEAAGASLRSLGDMFSMTTRHPLLSLPRVLRNLRRRVEAEGIDLVIVDPLSASILLPPGTTADQNLLYATMLPVVDAVQDAGGTLLLTHHTTKPAARSLRATQLTDAAGGGHDGWARFWIALSRRTAYDPATPGRHELHLSSGVSGGFSTAVDLMIGEYGENGSRKWSAVASMPVKKAKTADADRDAAAAAIANDRHRRLLAALAGADRPMPASSLEREVQGGRKWIEAACADLARQGKLEEAGTTPKGKPLYRITDVGRGEAG